MSEKSTPEEFIDQTKIMSHAFWSKVQRRGRDPTAKSAIAAIDDKLNLQKSQLSVTMWRSAGDFLDAEIRSTYPGQSSNHKLLRTIVLSRLYHFACISKGSALFLSPKKPFKSLKFDTKLGASAERTRGVVESFVDPGKGDVVANLVTAINKIPSNVMAFFALSLKPCNKPTTARWGF
jgi:hypothetical protein